MSCDFYRQFGTHADTVGYGVATCCDVGPVVLDNDGNLVPRLPKKESR